jgi:hypothetical protein
MLLNALQKANWEAKQKKYLIIDSNLLLFQTEFRVF